MACSAAPRTRQFSPQGLVCVALLVGNSLAAAAAEPASAIAQPAPGDSKYRDYDASHPYLNDGFSPGDGSESGIDELAKIGQPEYALLGPEGARSPLGSARDKFDALYERTGLRLGSALTGLGLKAFGAGDPSGTAYDLDLMSAWTLVGRGTANSGMLVATVEYRDKIGSNPASSVGPEIGTLINTTNAFNDRGWVTRDAYWLQRLLDGRLRILVGRADTSDYVGQQPMQNVNASFVNRSFSANPTVPFPGHGATIGVSVVPNDKFYVTGGIANAYNVTTRSELDTISDRDFFYTAEAGWTPVVSGLGTGRYSVMVWHIDARNKNGFSTPSDDGVTLVAGQQFTDRFQVWARYGYADGRTTNIRQLAQAGLGYSGLFGSPSNLTGFAASYADPRAETSQNEKVLEIFQRLQVTRFTQASIGAQVVFDPGNNPDESNVELLYARLRVAF